MIRERYNTRPHRPLWEILDDDRQDEMLAEAWRRNPQLRLRDVAREAEELYRVENPNNL